MTARSSNPENDPAESRVAGPAGVVRRALGRGPSREQQLEQLLAEKRAELEEDAARFEEAALELGRREERLRDERASVERLLRRTTAELEAREAELVQFERELGERDQHLAAAEAGLARRRSDLGAVELKRAALEQREHMLETREEELAAGEARFEQARAAEAAAGAAALFFVPGPSYRLVEQEPVAASLGEAVQIAGEAYVVARVGPSPSPADTRRCAYLVRGVQRPGESGGSS